MQQTGSLVTSADLSPEDREEIRTSCERLAPLAQEVERLAELVVQGRETFRYLLQEQLADLGVQIDRHRSLGERLLGPERMRMFGSLLESVRRAHSRPAEAAIRAFTLAGLTRILVVAHEYELGAPMDREGAGPSWEALMAQRKGRHLSPVSAA